MGRGRGKTLWEAERGLSRTVALRAGAGIAEAERFADEVTTGAVAAVIAARLEAEQRTALKSVRQSEREVAELGRRLARVTIALRRRPLPCGAARHRRAPSSGSARRRGSRRCSSGTRAGPSDDGPGEPPGDLSRRRPGPHRGEHDVVGRSGRPCDWRRL